MDEQLFNINFVELQKPALKLDFATKKIIYLQSSDVGRFIIKNQDKINYIEFKEFDEFINFNSSDEDLEKSAENMILTCCKEGFFEKDGFEAQSAANGLFITVDGFYFNYSGLLIYCILDILDGVSWIAIKTESDYNLIDNNYYTNQDSIYLADKTIRYSIKCNLDGSYGFFAFCHNEKLTKEEAMEFTLSCLKEGVFDKILEEFYIPSEIALEENEFINSVKALYTFVDAQSDSTIISNPGSIENFLKSILYEAVIGPEILDTLNDSIKNLSNRMLEYDEDEFAENALNVVKETRESISERLLALDKIHPHND